MSVLANQQQQGGILLDLLICRNKPFMSKMDTHYWALGIFLATVEDILLLEVKHFSCQRLTDLTPGHIFETMKSVGKH